MGGHYERDMFKQLMEVQTRLEAMEEAHKKDRKEIAFLTGEVERLREENQILQAELTAVREENRILRAENAELRKENALLRQDNERMKRILSNNSSNSSLPPSGDAGRGKAPNTYNGREKTKKKAGGQKGHPGKHLSRAEVERKIREGLYEHRVEEIGTPGGAYVTRYRLDLKVKTVATEIRIYADADGKYQIPKGMEGEVFYGDTIQGIVGYLYSVDVMANDRIGEFLNALSGGALNISTGSVYGLCQKLGENCAQIRPVIEEDILNSSTVCTDATTIKTNGVQTYIRNFSTDRSALYVDAEKKNLKTLGEMRILKEFTGTLIHDHETALYHFGTGHGECNVHLERYLKKNTEETRNSWSRNMSGFLRGMNHARKKELEAGKSGFSAERLERYEKRYDEILTAGRAENRHTKGRVAKKEEKALLNRLEAYKANYLLFLHDFDVPFSNNMSEKDLRICKNRQKMAGGFRNSVGRRMYCDILSFVETVKRRGLNVFESIAALINGAPVLS